MTYNVINKVTGEVVYEPEATHYHTQLYFLLATFRDFRRNLEGHLAADATAAEAAFISEAREPSIKLEPETAEALASWLIMRAFLA